MAIKKRDFSAEHCEQLALGLDLGEEGDAPSGFVSPEEARQRSLAARSALQDKPDEDPPEWFEQYAQLLDAGWPWRVACYIAWAASPKKGRWPKTQEELANQVLGLTSDRVIGTWRKKNANIDTMISILQAAPLMDHRADVIRALVQSATTPSGRNFQDRRMYLEITGDYTPKIKVEDGRRGDDDDLQSMSDDELRDLTRGRKIEPTGSEPEEQE